MKAKLKDIGQDTIITSLAFAILGIVLIMFPGLTVRIISYIVGIILGVIGIIKIFVYYKKNGQSDIFNNELTYGVLALIGGAMVVIFVPIITEIFRIMIGLFIVYNGSVKLIFGLKLKSISKKLGSLSIFSAIIMLICGLIILFYYNSIMVALGITLLVFSIMNLLEGLIYMKNVDNVYKKIKEDKVIIEEE